RAGAKTEPRDDWQYQTESRVRVCLQLGGDSHCCGRFLSHFRLAAEPHASQRRDELQFRLRHRQRLAAPQGLSVKPADLKILPGHRKDTYERHHEPGPRIPANFLRLWRRDLTKRLA